MSDPDPTPERPDSIRLLFVCMGNICRSPAAEAVFRGLVEKAGLQDRLRCDSAGTIDHHEGKPADSRMVEHAARRGIVIRHLARGVQPRDFADFDLILVMDDFNERDLLSMTAKHTQKAKIRKMTDFCMNVEAADVPDPYYGGPEGFERVLDILEDSCAGLLAELRGWMAG